MDTYIRFLYEFLKVFFDGLGMIFGGIVNGFIQMFNPKNYIYTIEFYKNDFNGPEWVAVGFAILILVLLLGLILLIIYFIARKFLKFRKTLVEQESMLEEIGELNKTVKDLVEEKEKILAMKVSQLGLKPGEEAEITNEEEVPEGEENTDPDQINLDNVRFSKLHAIDVKYKGYVILWSN